jgi:protein-tyrosine-phosphatase
MAAGLLQDAAQKASLNLEVQSAGIAAFPGVPYSSETVEVLREKGIDLSGGVSQPLSKSLVMESDLLLTMTPEHRDAILRKLPILQGKVFLLSDYVGDGEVAVADPVGQPIEVYRDVRAQLEVYVQKVVEKLRV